MTETRLFFRVVKAWSSAFLKGSKKDLAPNQADVVVYVLMITLGMMWFGLYLRAGDFIDSGAASYELARSILEKGSYVYNSRPETVAPPGLPLIVALICTLFGCSYGLLIRSMVVFATLGLIASYELLRRSEGRTAAAATCLLLASSPAVFYLSTTSLSSDLPYFFVTMLALVVVSHIEDSNTSPPARTGWLLLLGFLLGAAVMIRSAGIALLGGFCGWLAVSFAAGKSAMRRRVQTFLPILVFGIGVQACWMYWAAKNEFSEWPIGGYPKSYFSQITIKSGHYPELGYASVGDIPLRVARNLAARSVGLPKLLTLRNYWIDESWYSPVVWIPVLLVLLGLGRSMWPTGGGMMEWYFVMHEAMYLLWPWNLELRFLLPIAPLACVYIWRGARLLYTTVGSQPRKVSRYTLILSLILTMYALCWIKQQGGIQVRLSALFWVVSTFISGSVVLLGWRPMTAFAAFSRQVPLKPFAKTARATVLEIVGGVILILLVTLGIAGQIRMGRDNMNPDITKMGHYGYIGAGQWIRSHTELQSVVMARHVDVVHHFSQRQVVWFPPISDTQVLMDGISKYHVKWIIVGDGSFRYFLPTDKDCFEPLLRMHPELFRLVRTGPRDTRIFEVLLPN